MSWSQEKKAIKNINSSTAGYGAARQHLKAKPSHAISRILRQTGVDGKLLLKEYKSATLTARRFKSKLQGLHYN
jgi:hypothetical protein